MTIQVRNAAIQNANVRPVDMKLEVIVIPVSDVDRAKQFYSQLGWRHDAEFVEGDDFRILQFTPPGSGASVIFGKGVTPAAPGSAQGLYLVVSDIEAARKELLDRGIKVSEVFHHAAARTPVRTSLICSAASGSAARIRSAAPTARTSRSTIRTATAGCCRRSPRGFPGAWTRTRRRSLRWPTWPARSGARQPHTASTRSGPADSMMRTGRTGTPSTSRRAGRQGAAAVSPRQRHGHRARPR